jgi:hypothetical protein
VVVDVLSAFPFPAPPALSPRRERPDGQSGKLARGSAGALPAASPEAQPSGQVPRHCPAPDRRDPQSQSFSRSYGSNLPTSLTYIALWTRGCAPRRPAAEIRYDPARRCSSPSLGFSRIAAARRTSRRQRPCGTLFASPSLARGDGLSGTRGLRQKRQLFPAAATTLPSQFGSPRRPPPPDGDVNPNREHRDKPGSGGRHRYPDIVGGLNRGRARDRVPESAPVSLSPYARGSKN